MVAFDFNVSDHEEAPLVNGLASLALPISAGKDYHVGVVYYGDTKHKGSHTVANILAAQQPNVCCVCQYDDRSDNVCAKYKPENISDCPFNENGVNCIGEEDGGKFSCIPYFRKVCQDWLSTQGGDCSIKKMTPIGVVPSQESLAECKKMKGYVAQHSEVEKCGAFEHDIESCLNCIGPECKNISFTHMGCRTFGNDTVADTWMKHLKSKLKPGQTLKVTANQDISTPTCTSYETYELTIDTLNVHADYCQIDNFCSLSDQPHPVWCTLKSDNKQVQEICCRNPEKRNYSNPDQGNYIQGKSCPWPQPKRPSIRFVEP